MTQPIEYKKVMNEIVYVNLPGPGEPSPGMTGGELLHGFLADLYKTDNTEMKKFVDYLCMRWNVVYREYRG
jgi:hypothetical protein